MDEFLTDHAGGLGKGAIVSRVKIGERVGAIASADDEAVKLYGFGVYEGEQEMGLDIPGLMGITGREMIAEAREWGWPEEAIEPLHHQTNPRIRLDSGDVVWGCQCWWGSEEAARKAIDGRVVEVVPVPAGGEEP